MEVERAPAMTVALIILTASSGCAGYWSSGKANKATFVGAEAFQIPSSVIPVHVTVLGRHEREDGGLAAVLEAKARRIEQTDVRDKALQYADLGILAMYANKLKLAERALDRAILVMSSVTIAGQRERHATSLFGGESEKLFKGEPHERAITYLFRGLLYLSKGDFENAQAYFRAGTLQDALAKSKGALCNWLSHDLLLLESRRLLHDPSWEKLADFIRTRYGAGEIPSDWAAERRAPVILLVVVGEAPEKVAAQSKGQELQYREHPSRVASIRVSSAEQTLTHRSPVDDCFVQAATRGKRHMDAVLAGQASTKSGVEIAGTTAAFAGAVLNAVPGAGLAGGLVKAVSWSVSDSINTSADIRQMDMVPGKIFLSLWDADQIEGKLLLEILDRQGKTIGRGTLAVEATAGKPTVALARFPY